MIQRGSLPKSSTRRSPPKRRTRHGVVQRHKAPAKLIDGNSLDGVECFGTA